MKRNALFVLLFAGVQLAPAASQDIRMMGTDTLILLGQRWSQGFHAKQPDISIQVQGGGLASGLKALASGQVQIVQAEKSVATTQELKIPIGVQGIAVYVNRQNPLG